MEHHRSRTGAARVGVAALCGLLVVAVSLLGYDPKPQDAGAAIQPAPTSIAFVPLHPEPAPVVQARALQAGRMMAMPGGPSEMVAPAGGPEPAAALLPGADACSFPCFDPDRVEGQPNDETAPEAETGPEQTVVELTNDTVAIETTETSEQADDQGNDEPDEQD